MKKILNVFFVIVMMLVIFPSSIYATVEDELKQKLDRLPFEQLDSGDKTIRMQMLNPGLNIGDKCVQDAEEISEWYEPDEFFPTLEEYVKYQENICKGYIYRDSIYAYLKVAGYDINGFDISFNESAEENNFDKATFSYYKMVCEDDTCETHTVEVESQITYLESHNDSVYRKAQELLNGIGDKVTLSGLDLINTINHYGEISDSDYLEDKILSRFSKFKKVIEKNPEFQFVSTGGRGGCGADICSRHIQVGIAHNGILYATKEIFYEEIHILYVSDKTNDSIEEKTYNRLNSFFKNKVNLEIEVDEQDENEINNGTWFDNDMNKYLNTSNLDYTGYYTTIKMDNHKTHMIVVEVPERYLDKYSVESFDKKSNVSVKTDSYDVPIDATVIANNITNNKDLNKLFNNLNMNVEVAMDIDLIKAFNNTYINKIENGIEVYMPVDNNYSVGEKVDVFYVKTNNEVGDAIEGEIVLIDDQKFVKFVTYHFSKYALATKTSNNPQTSDNIMFNMIIGVLFSFMFVFCIKKLHR